MEEKKRVHEPGAIFHSVAAGLLHAVGVVVHFLT